MQAQVAVPDRKWPWKVNDSSRIPENLYSWATALGGTRPQHVWLMRPAQASRQALSCWDNWGKHQRGIKEHYSVAVPSGHHEQWVAHHTWRLLGLRPRRQTKSKWRKDEGTQLAQKWNFSQKSYLMVIQTTVPWMWANTRLPDLLVKVDLISPMSLTHSLLHSPGGNSLRIDECMEMVFPGWVYSHGNERKQANSLTKK